jgi:hypothetical protein
MPIANAKFRPLPPLGVHVGHPLHERRKVAITFGPQYKVPVVRHPAIGTDADLRDAERLFNHAMKGLVVFLSAENLHSPDAPIEHMK